MDVASRGSHGLGGVNGKGLTGRIELAIQGRATTKKIMTGMACEDENECRDFT
jgi:hypothetical protein